MKTKSKYPLCQLVFLPLLFIILITQSFGAVSITGITFSKNTVSTYETLEVTFNLSTTFSNPYNPDEIDIKGIFSRDGYASQTCYGFWYQPYSISSGVNNDESYTVTGSPRWMIRYTPGRAGNINLLIEVTSQYGNTSSEKRTINIQPGNRQGFIRLHPDNKRFFQFDNGDIYYPRGHDLSGSSFGTHPTLDGVTAARFYYPRLSANRINWARFWLTNVYKNAIEWTGTGYSGPGSYSLAKAYRTDEIMNTARDNGVNIHFTLNDFRHVSNWGDIYWPQSPYNALNGGPVPNTRPQDFFSNTTAKTLFKRYLRYCVSRWGHLPNLFAWELFNEVEYTCDTQQNVFTNSTVKNNVIAWHQEMAHYLKTIDPYQHLVTTSSDDPWYAQYGYFNYSLFSSIWELPDIDIIQTHVYTYDIEDDINYECQLFRTLYPEKAHMIGEFGIQNLPEFNNQTAYVFIGDGFDPTTFIGTTTQRDHLIEGTHFHNALWTALLNETMAGLWWWDYYLEADTTRHRLSPQFPLYYHYPPLEAYMRITLNPGQIPYEDWPHYNLNPAELVVSSNLKATGLTNTERGYLWFRDIKNDYFYNAEPGDMVNRTISGESIIVKGLAPDAKYTLQYYDTYHSGGPLGSPQDRLSSSSGILTITIPDFQRDMALKLMKTDVLTAVEESQWKYYELMD